MKARVVLDLNDFRALVRGQEVNKEDADIILSDIGLTQIQRAVDLGVAEKLCGVNPDEVEKLINHLPFDYQDILVRKLRDLGKLR
jgi:hypothetical protein